MTITSDINVIYRVVFKLKYTCTVGYVVGLTLVLFTFSRTCFIVTRLVCIVVSCLVCIVVVVLCVLLLVVLCVLL